MAYFSGQLVSGICIYSLRRQQKGASPPAFKYFDCMDAHRYLAWSRMEFSALGIMVCDCAGVGETFSWEAVILAAKSGGNSLYTFDCIDRLGALCIGDASGTLPISWRHDGGWRACGSTGALSGKPICRIAVYLSICLNAHFSYVCQGTGTFQDRDWNSVLPFWRKADPCRAFIVVHCRNC